MRKKIFLTALLALAGNTHAEQKTSSVTGFQNIPWNSTINFVAKKLPSGKIENSCLSGDKDLDKKMRDWAKESNDSCKSISWTPYVIADFKFSLIASFNAKERLSGVRIRYSPDVTENEEDAFKNCADAYEKILSLLEIKYGDSVGVKNGSPAFRYQNFEMRAWVLSPTEIWLRKSTGKTSEWQRKCTVEINYGPRISENVDKL